MNWGLRNRLDRVLPRLSKSTESVIFAIDHGYFMGPTSGIKAPQKTINNSAECIIMYLKKKITLEKLTKNI